MIPSLPAIQSIEDSNHAQRYQEVLKDGPHFDICRLNVEAAAICQQIADQLKRIFSSFKKKDDPTAHTSISNPKSYPTKTETPSCVVQIKITTPERQEAMIQEIMKTYDQVAIKFENIPELFNLDPEDPSKTKLSDRNFSKVGGIFKIPEDELKEMIRDPNGEHLVFVATDGEQMQGFFTLETGLGYFEEANLTAIHNPEDKSVPQDFKTNFWKAFCKEKVVGRIDCVIKPEFQNQGIGQILLYAPFETLDEMGATFTAEEIYTATKAENPYRGISHDLNIPNPRPMHILTEVWGGHIIGTMNRKPIVITNPDNPEDQWFITVHSNVVAVEIKTAIKRMQDSIHR